MRHSRIPGKMLQIPPEPLFTTWESRSPSSPTTTPTGAHAGLASQGRFPSSSDPVLLGDFCQFNFQSLERTSPLTPFYKDHLVELPSVDHLPTDLVIFAVMVRVGGRGLSHITQLLSPLAGESGACCCHSSFFSRVGFFPRNLEGNFRC